MRRRAIRPGGRDGSLRCHDARPTRREVEALPQGGEAPAATAVCDFCTLAPARWSYPCRTFRLQLQDAGRTEFTSVGGWGACDACRELVDARRESALLGRVMRGNIEKGIVRPDGPAFQVRCEDMLRTLALFFFNRIGPVEEYADAGAAPTRMESP